MNLNFQALKGFFLSYSGKIKTGSGDRMNQRDVIQIIKLHRQELADVYAVQSLALFGSVARNEAGSTSDVDLLVEFDRPVGLFGLFALQDRLEELFDCKVDVGTPDSLKPRLRPTVMSELVYVS